MSKMMFKAALVASATVAAAAFATPASAALVFNPSAGTVTVSGTSGGTVNLNFGGNSGTVDVPGLTGSLALTFASKAGNVYTFSYVVANTSTAPVTASRLSAFGFDTTPDITGASISSTGNVFTNAVLDGSLPNQFGAIGVCFTAQSCPGGGNGGLQMGQSNSGTFTLDFGNANTANGFVMDNFGVRYQSLAAPGAASNSATGKLITAVPEPGTWALMLVGFGAVGYSMRRRRRVTALPQMA